MELNPTPSGSNRLFWLCYPWALPTAIESDAFSVHFFAAQVSHPLPQRDMRSARALDALRAFISGARQIQTTKQVLPTTEQHRHDCQM
jgi:hypothetical protein